MGSVARRAASDAGSATVLAVAVCGAVLTVSGVVLTAGTVLAADTRASSAADAAALATADAASGASPGVPCDEARRVAAAGGARLVRCDVSGDEARIVVTVATTIGAVSGRARAGPPPG